MNALDSVIIVMYLLEMMGLLRWRSDLPPASNETLGFRYTVKSPKSREVLLE